MARTERLNIRVTPTLKRNLETAASASGKTVADFVISILEERGQIATALAQVEKALRENPGQKIEVIAPGRPPQQPRDIPDQLQALRQARASIESQQGQA